jgi:hypothetical protein
MRLVRYGVVAVLALGLLVTSVGWYLSAHPGGTRFALPVARLEPHPGGTRFESCHWQGDQLVLGYTYGTGDTVTTVVHPAGDHVVAQLRVDEGGGNHTLQVLTGQGEYQISGGPLPVKYPNGAELNCPVR